MIKVTREKKRPAVFLLLGLCICMAFSACGKSIPERQTSRPENEGIDTQTEIVGFTDYDGEHADIFLKEGDPIALISPSTTPSREQTDAVIKGLSEWGYVPVEGKYACVKERTLENCIEDLSWALEDPEIKAIFCIRGGYAATEVLDSISLDMIQKSGKLIIGYSDITAYHAGWTTLGLPSLHSCMSATFTDLPEECAEAERKLLQGKVPTYRCQANSYCNEGNAKGILIGGNLSTFIACLGTDYDPTLLEEPYILFLEDVEENLQHIHRCLTVLKHMGVLDKAAGIVFGEWTDTPEDSGDYDGDSRGGAFSSVSDMIHRQFAEDMDIPVAYGFPAGHGDINYPLLMGEELELTVEKDSFTLAW